MSTATYAGVTVDVNEEGYLTNAAPAQPASSPPRLRGGGGAAAGRLLFPNTTTPDKP